MLRIVFKGRKSSKLTYNYVDVEFEHWSVVEALLCVYTGKATQYFPLTNIEYFYELEDTING